LAINAIGRAQFACEKKHLETEQVTERFAFQYVQEFCRLQPYAGVGLGIYWVDISNNAFSAHANFVPGFNALAGVRYYITDRIAMFTEYKYNRATFNFSGVSGLAGFQGDYSVNHIVWRYFLSLLSSLSAPLDPAYSIVIRYFTTGESSKT
jgi:hypothetical protein